MAKAAKSARKIEELTAELVRDTPSSKLWLIRNQDRVVKCFVEKFKPTPGCTDPYKIFTAICGQGPVHVGEMLGVDYGARNATQAASSLLFA